MGYGETVPSRRKYEEMSLAAEQLASDYQAGGELTDKTSSDGEHFFKP